MIIFGVKKMEYVTQNFYLVDIDFEVLDNLENDISNVTDEYDIMQRLHRRKEMRVMKKFINDGKKIPFLYIEDESSIYSNRKRLKMRMDLIPDKFKDLVLEFINLK